MPQWSRKWNLPYAQGIDTGYCTKSLKMLNREQLIKLGIQKGRIPCPLCGKVLVPEWATEILDTFTWPRHTKPEKQNAIPVDSASNIEPLF